MQVVTILVLSCCLAVGAMTGLLAYMKLWLARNPDVAPPRVGTMLSLLNLGIVLMMVLAGVLADTLGARAVLIGGSVALSVGLLALGATGNSAQAPYAVGIAALGTCAVAIACSASAAAVGSRRSHAYARRSGRVSYRPPQPPRFLTTMCRVSSWRKRLNCTATGCSYSRLGCH